MFKQAFAMLSLCTLALLVPSAGHAQTTTARADHAQSPDLLILSIGGAVGKLFANQNPNAGHPHLQFNGSVDARYYWQGQHGIFGRFSAWTGLDRLGGEGGYSFRVASELFRRGTLGLAFNVDVGGGYSRLSLDNHVTCLGITLGPLGGGCGSAATYQEYYHQAYGLVHVAGHIRLRALDIALELGARSGSTFAFSRTGTEGRELSNDFISLAGGIRVGLIIDSL